MKYTHSINVLRWKHIRKWKSLLADKGSRFIRTPKTAATMAALLIMVCALMLPPVIGVADNGDFYSVADGMGIYKLDRFRGDQYFSYASSKFGVYEYFNESESSPISSQRIFISMALMLDRIFTGEDHLFDIRFLGILYILYACISIYLLLDFITYKKSVKEGWMLSALGVFIFADTGYTAYFNSFYTEGLVYVSFLAAISCALLITQKRYSFKRMFWLFIVNSAVLIGCGIFVYTAIPQNYRNINQYHAMTRGVMREAENPESALDFFGIDPQYSLLNETVFFERYPPVNADSEILEDGFYNKYDSLSICAYYISHPETLFRMLTDAVQEAYMIRPDMLGNYDRSEGKLPGAKTDFFTGYSTFKRKAVPVTLGFVVIWMLLVMVLNRKDREKMMILLCTILAGLQQIGISVVEAGGTDLSRHVFLYNAAFDLVTYVSMSSIVISAAYMFKGIAGRALKGKNRCEKKKNAGKKAV